MKEADDDQAPINEDVFRDHTTFPVYHNPTLGEFKDSVVKKVIDIIDKRTKAREEINTRFPKVTLVPLLQEIYINQDVSIPEGISLKIERLILIYSVVPSISPDDVITMHIAGRIPFYYYTLHAKPYLSQFLAYGLEIEISPFIITPNLIFKFKFPDKFRLFISGIKQYKN
jgi:hypothetical protein